MLSFPGARLPSLVGKPVTNSEKKEALYALYSKRNLYTFCPCSSGSWCHSFAPAIANRFRRRDDLHLSERQRVHVRLVCGGPNVHAARRQSNVGLVAIPI